MLKRLFYSLPIQLFLLNIKRQHFYLLLWFTILGFVNEWIGKKFGIVYLFLDPEYLGEVNFLSFFIMGVCMGGFLMSYNIASYIIYGREIPFLAGFKRPFLRFTLNNFIVPTFFLSIYLYRIISFQAEYELKTFTETALSTTGFLVGLLIFILISFTYFFNTNKDVFRMFGVKLQRKVKKAFLFQRKVLNKKFQWEGLAEERQEIPVQTFLDFDLKLKPIRYSTQFEYKNLLSVLRQNHLNAIIIQLIVLVLIVLLGLLRDFPIFQIPAGASVLIFFSMLIMISGAFSFWLRRWGFTAFIMILVVYNLLSQFDPLYYRNTAYGLNYDTEPAVLSKETVNAVDPDKFDSDYNETVEILEKWKARNQKGFKKPKLIVINASGGGQRSALFTFSSLQHIDSVMEGELFDQCVLLTGASGGLIGASYLRELHLQKLLGEIETPYAHKYRTNISKDLLNPIIFSIVVNDIFYPMQTFKYGGYTYRKDRGTAFENTLNRNLEGVFEKPLMAYQAFEKEALVPMIVFSPTSVNDGRRIYISAQPVSYLVQPESSKDKEEDRPLDGIEFMRFFEKQDARNLSFLSALRMNSNFPYISPNTSLPSEPIMEVIDAGLRDNFGKETSLRFIYVFRDWIAKNTSGVVVIQMRDTPQNEEIDPNSKNTIMAKIFKPVRGFYANWENYQQFNQDNQFDILQSLANFPMEKVTFQYAPPDQSVDVSLSWHLTSLEKKNVQQGIYFPQNQRELKRLMELVK